MVGPPTTPSFDIQHEAPTTTLVAGFAEFGLAGLTAANYITETLELERTGHISVEQLPAVTPFEDGTPRHHTRLFSRADLDITVVVGELFVPPYAAEPFGNALLEYTDEHGVEEVVVLSGVPIQHGPDDHRPFYIASDDYQSARLDVDHDITAIPFGFLERINGELMERAVDSTLKTCVLTTPVHPQAPDIDAALRLVGALDSIYHLDIDTGPLEEFAETLSKQYEELAARLEAQREEMLPEDRMYM
mgnify:FL=1